MELGRGWLKVSGGEDMKEEGVGLKEGLERMEMLKENGRMREGGGV